MQQWDERIEGHAIWQHLGEVTQLLSATATDDRWSADAAEELSRIVSLISRGEALLGSADRRLMSANVLTSANQQLAKIQQQITAAQNEDNPDHLSNASAHAENFVAQLTSLPRPESSEDLRALQAEVDAYRQFIAQRLQQAEEAHEKHRAELASLEQKLAEAKTEAEEQKGRLDQAIATFHQQFSESDSKWREQFQARLEERVEAWNEALESARAQLTKVGAEQRESGSDIIADLEGKQQKAEKIVGAIAQTGMAGGYQKVANRQQVQMWVWQGVTVLSLVAFVVVVLAFLIPDGTDGFSWPGFAQRLLVAAAFGALAGFGAREAAGAAEKERRNRRLELELASIGPFLAELPKDKREELIEKFTERTFGQGVGMLEVEGSQLTSNGLLDLLRLMITDLLKRK